MTETTIAVLGLGEAGAAFALDLVAAAAVVRGYDPSVTAPEGVIDCTDEADAVHTAELILSVNRASAAITAFQAAADQVSPGAVWADLNTADPGLERTLGSQAAGRGITFADVSIMAPVPGRGLSTPMLASGPGARDVARLLGMYGATVTVLDGQPGAAAERKLLRSVFYKGMSAAVVEALGAARVLGLEDWLTDVITEELTTSGAHSVERIVTGTNRHAVRRADEMEAAAKMLADLGVDHDVADASAVLLRKIIARSRPTSNRDLDA
jgi:3-hydroxyisobutyrate dehydrogenase-like beta-hydroxyacid dehydrogenase